jgi:16S rRNA (cytosine967-C5)-methyltransferase
LDDAIDRYLKKNLSNKAVRVRHILRIGAAEILFLDTPPHAAVDNAVQQTASHIKTNSFKGLVNAVLRRVTENKDDILADQDEASLNTPPWLRESWIKAHGKEVASEIARAHLKMPSLDISLKQNLNPEEHAKVLDAKMLTTGSLRREIGGLITALPGFEEGNWWVQDTAATLPVKLFGDVKGQTVIDLCSAPGGKTAQLVDRGAKVISVERTPGRLKTTRQNMERLGLSPELIEADAAKWIPEAPAPYVLLDAPCSATGTLRRHPDVAYLKTPNDVAKLTVAQARLLNAAAKMVAPGGMLVYCVCSLQSEEGVDRIEAFLGANADWRRAPINAQEIGGLENAITESGDLRTLPSHLGDIGGMDGFYAARLVKSQ